VITNPRRGQRVRLHYAKRSWGWAVFQGRTGTVSVPGRGKPRNHLVRLDDGPDVVVPCGNLVPAADRPPEGTT
jgi:hypothetical protein